VGRSFKIQLNRYLFQRCLYVVFPIIKQYQLDIKQLWWSLNYKRASRCYNRPNFIQRTLTVLLFPCWTHQNKLSLVLVRKSLEKQKESKRLLSQAKTRVEQHIEEASPEGGRMKDLKARTKEFALRVIRLYSALPKTTEAQVIGKQLLRSGTSVGAHYREGTRARSDAEFISKLEGGLQELEESVYWMELLIEASMLPENRLAELLKEADELTAILITCVKNAKDKR
jgi:four helix bundle protein